MTATTATLTADDLWNLPNDHMRHELVKGELTTMAPTAGEHGIRTLNIALAVGNFIRSNNLGVGLINDVGFIIARNPDTVRAPDFAFVSTARIPADGIPKKFWPGAPDFAVEVLSPSDSATDVDDKIDDWLNAGVRLLWIVNPHRKTVTVYAPNRQPTILRLADILSGEDILPGLKLTIAEIFS